MQKKLIEFQTVSLGYGRRTVLKGVSFSLNEGDFFGIVGPNGSGKTTLLRGMLKVLRPQKGQIVFARPPDDQMLTFGYVPQEKEVDPLFPLSAMDVVLMARTKMLGPWRRPGKKDREIAMRSLDHTGIAHLAETPFQELSGGQKQRVLIARALTAEPHVLILDEPTSGMDLPSERGLMELIQSLHEKEHLTIIMATHNLNLVANYAKRIAIVNEGRLVVGETKEILSEESLSCLYGMSVRVREVEGRRIIV